MPDTSQQVLYTIVAIIITLLFLGILFLVMLLYFQNRKRKFYHEKQLLEAAYNQQLLQSQLEIQEQTFTNISQEIHDNVGQSLSLAKMQLHILNKGEMYNKLLIADSIDSVSKALVDLRDIAKSLNTERIQQSSLQDVISQELLRINHSGLLTTNLHVEGSGQIMHSQKKLIVFRMVQEALQNIIKHSNANRIDIECYYNEQYLQIKVIDNGKGFDKRLIKKDGLGLSNITNRAALIGGKADIDSIINKGTTITIVTPYI